MFNLNVGEGPTLEGHTARYTFPFIRNIYYYQLPKKTLLIRKHDIFLTSHVYIYICQLVYVDNEGVKSPLGKGVGMWARKQVQAVAPVDADLRTKCSAPQEDTASLQHHRGS